MKNKIRNGFSIIIVTSLLIFLSAATCKAHGIKVKNLAEFNKAVKNAKPGSSIILANGVWKNVELIFSAKGTKNAPITLTVETKGKVTLEGQSDIKIAGEYLVVEGLVFKNGYTPIEAVIAFRKNDKELCNNCRVTECVIDNFSNPERFESDYWVEIYGKNNRFDHNYLTGKSNQGVTLAVRLLTQESRENNHQIDHNYFGHRPVLGSNGGETIRIGTSFFAATNSKTIVESNYFDHCNGEHEIVSNKSGQNIFRNNTFHECQGTLTMRHGNETLVENNYFFGNGKANTGGIRIINESQKVINNYCEGLTGYRFRGALVIMNGVPNSAPNRYVQVKNSEASNNTFVNCDYIQLAAGSDKERTATPQSTLIANNLFYNENKADIFTIYDDISGISFKNNLLGPNIKPFQKEGFFEKKLSFERNKDGLLMPKGGVEMGMKNHGEIPSPTNSGVSWYPLNEQEQMLNTGTGRIILVKAGVNTLVTAVLNSRAGDIIELQDAGEYLTTKSIDIVHPITFKNAGGLPTKPVLKFKKSSLFNIENGGALSLIGLSFSGTEADDRAGNAVIRTSRYSMNQNYKLFIDDCDFSDMDVNYSFDLFKVYQNTFADSIVLRNSRFTNITGSVLSLNKENEDLGIYNAENVVIENCAFKDIGGMVLNLYRGGTDESTFGPNLTIEKSTFNKVGLDRHNGLQASLYLHGVQVANLKNNVFKDSRPIKLFSTNGDPVTNITSCQFENTPKIVANDAPYHTENLQYR